MNARKLPPREKGFTLIELMVTIAVAAILMMVGVPSFVAFHRNSQLTSAANSFIAALNAARGEAMKRGRQAVVVPRADNDWATGWTVFVDTDNNRKLDDSDILITRQMRCPPTSRRQAKVRRRAALRTSCSTLRATRRPAIQPSSPPR